MKLEFHNRLCCPPTGKSSKTPFVGGCGKLYNVNGAVSWTMTAVLGPCGKTSFLTALASRAFLGR
jgi:hypothetical protein